MSARICVATGGHLATCPRMVKFGFDFETMEFALRRAGFGEVVRQRHGRSLDPALVLDPEHHAPYSLYVDARR